MQYTMINSLARLSAFSGILESLFEAVTFVKISNPSTTFNGQDKVAFAKANLLAQFCNLKPLIELFVNSSEFKIKLKDGSEVDCFRYSLVDNNSENRVQTIQHLQGLVGEAIARIRLYPSNHVFNLSVEIEDQVQDSMKSDHKNIFIVHGHNLSLLEQTENFLLRQGLQFVILSQQVNEGLTLIEKVERHANQAAFAIILYTGDDEVIANREKNGRLEAMVSYRQARPNVLIEIGYFWGLLGRQKVAVLAEEGARFPSDLKGLGYISVADPTQWKLKLCQELKKAGFAADANRIQ